MIRVTRRTSPRTYVTAGSGALAVALLLGLALLALLWRALLALLVVAVLYGVYRLARSVRRG